MATNGARGPMDAFVVMRKRSAIFGGQATDDGEDELSMAAGAWAGGGRPSVAAAPGNAEENEDEGDDDDDDDEESLLPLVTSDLVPTRGRKPKPKPPPPAPASEDEGDEADESLLPIVTSDLFGSSRRSKPSQPPPSTTTHEMATPVAAPLQSRHNKMRLAVHIRSSPITPLTHINPPANHEPSPLPAKQNRSQRAAEPKPPKPPKTPKTTRSLANNGYPKPDVMIRTPRPNPKIAFGKAAYPADSSARQRKREARAAELHRHGHGHHHESKRRARRSPEPSIRTRYLLSEPEYIPYKCDWDMSTGPQQGERLICPAELHNIDTLRKHVYYVHADTDPLVCRFSHCRDHDPPLTFKTEADFEHHMEKKHFVAYLWHMGEGYQNKGTWMLEKKSAELPAYLFDKQGNQVTPSIAGQLVESHHEHKKRKRRLRKLLYEQNENAISEEEWMKQMLGTD